MNKNYISHYCKEVKKNLFCPKNIKEDIIRALKNDIDSFLLENPSASEQDIIERFGKPSEFADGSVSILDSDEIQKKLRKSSRFKHIIIIAAVIICFIVFTAAVCIVRENSRTAAYYYTEEIDEYIVNK